MIGMYFEQTDIQMVTDLVQIEIQGVRKMIPYL